MAKANADLVRRYGGLNHEQDYLSFRFEDEAEMVLFIEDAIALASAWLQLNLQSGIYDSADANIAAVLPTAEAFLALHYLGPHLKARKVLGTHYAWESEESDRYAELIDTEWLTLAQELLRNWITIITTSASFARPTLRVGSVIDPLSAGFPTSEEEWAEILDRARSLSVPVV